MVSPFGVRRMPGRLMTDREIAQALWLVTSQRVRHRPLSMQGIAARTGLTRRVIYLAREGRMSNEIRQLLSQVLCEVPVAEMLAAAAAGPGYGAGDAAKPA
jgi:hypothetical protein